MTSSGTRVTASGHARPLDGQTIASAIVVRSRSESVSAPGGPSSSQKTATGSTETAHGQRGSVTSHGESAFVHATANGLWSESVTRETGHATLETVNGHSDTLSENLDLSREINGKSVNGSGSQQSRQSRERVIKDHRLQRRRVCREGSASTSNSCEHNDPATATPGREEAAESLAPAQAEALVAPPPPPLSSPTERREGTGTLARTHTRDTIRLPQVAKPLKRKGGG